MPKISTVTFTGKSGTNYSFDVYGIDANWKNNVEAVYVVTRRYKGKNNQYYHDKVYIGETDNLKERFNDHHQRDCFDENNANCICIHLESSKTKRTTIETDLIRGNTTKCNDT